MEMLPQASCSNMAGGERKNNKKEPKKAMSKVKCEPAVTPADIQPIITHSLASLADLPPPRKMFKPSGFVQQIMSQQPAFQPLVQQNQPNTQSLNKVQTQDFDYRMLECGQDWGSASWEELMGGNPPKPVEYPRPVEYSTLTSTDSYLVSDMCFITNDHEYVFENKAKPELAVIVKRFVNNEYADFYCDKNGQQVARSAASKMATFSVNIRYWHKKEGNREDNSAGYQWTKMGVYLKFEEFAKLCAFIRRAKAVESKRESEGIVHYTPLVTEFMSLMCSIGYNAGGGGLMYLNKTGGDEHFQHQSMKIGGSAYPEFCGQIHNALDHIYRICEAPIYSYNGY